MPSARRVDPPLYPPQSRVIGWRGRVSSCRHMDIDSIIERLLAVKGSRPGSIVQLSDKEAIGLVTESQRIVEDQPVMLEIPAPLQIVGDIHGQYPDLLRLFEFRGMPPDANYLFLGNDYVAHSAPTVSAPAAQANHRPYAAGVGRTLPTRHEPEEPVWAPSPALHTSRL